VSEAVFEVRGGATRGRRFSGRVALLAAALSAGACVVAAAIPAGAAPAVIPVYGTSELDGIACMSSTYCIAVGGNDYVLIDSGTDGGANEVPGLQLDAVACPTSANCYAVGDAPGSTTNGVVVPFLYGEEMTPISVPGTVNLAAISCTPHTTACVAVGNGYNPGPPGTFFATVVNLAGGSPSGSVQQLPSLTGLNGVACPSTSCVAVGDASSNTGGLVSIVSGGSAGTVATPAGVYALDSVTCESVTTCWAGTADGDVVPLTSGVAGTPVPVPTTDGLLGGSCPTATQCYLAGNLSAGGGFVLPITNGIVGTPTTDLPGSGAVTGLDCISADACLGVGFTPNAGVLITSAVPTPPPKISSVSFSGTGYGVTVTVKGTNFEPWQPEASPTSPVTCAPGSPSYDYAAGVLSFSDTTEGWSAGAPGSCIGLVVKSWSSTAITFGFGTGYVWPLLKTGDAYQVSVLGATSTAAATVTANPAPHITSVVVAGTGGSKPPTLTVTGSGLGTRVPLNSGSPTCTGGDTSHLFPDDDVFVTDSSRGWTGGESGDCLGLSVTSFTSTKVVLTFGAFYGSVGALRLGDSIEVGLLNTTWTGLAATTPPPTITALKVTGTAAAPVITVSGNGFGASPPSPDPSTPITCVAGDTSFTYPAGQLQLSDVTQGWTGGETGDCIGLIVTSWSTTTVVLGMGADYRNFTPITAGDSIQVEVKGASFTAAAGV